MGRLRHRLRGHLAVLSSERVSLEAELGVHSLCCPGGSYLHLSLLCLLWELLSALTRHPRPFSVYPVLYSVYPGHGGSSPSYVLSQISVFTMGWFLASGTELGWAACPRSALSLLIIVDTCAPNHASCPSSHSGIVEGLHALLGAQWGVCGGTRLADPSTSSVPLNILHCGAAQPLDCGRLIGGAGPLFLGPDSGVSKFGGPEVLRAATWWGVRQPRGAVGGRRC